MLGLKGTLEINPAQPFFQCGTTTAATASMADVQGHSST